MRVLGSVAAVAAAAALGAAPAPAAPRDRVRAALDAAQASGALSPAEADADRATYGRALTGLARLRGVRRRELRSVVRIVRAIAARNALTAGRMPLVFLTIERNVEWWSAHGPPIAGSPGEKDARGRRCKPLGRATAVRARAARLTFPGSGVVWQYYPGLGLQVQVNGTFAAVNALLQSGRPDAAAEAAAILDEMRALASRRAGALTWEYLFPFGGGRPPWASGLAQATAIEAYLSASRILVRPDLLAVARELAGLFDLAPPAGVDVRLARDGSWFALYTFAPRARVLNSQLNAVIALHDLTEATGDERAAYLAREGLRATRRHIGRFDTGRWSRYAEHGPLADLNYHVLNRDLARELCRRTGQQAICTTWHSLTAELERRCPRMRPAREAADYAEIASTPAGGAPASAPHSG